MADNEAPEPDVAEQHRPASPADDEPDAVELAARNRPIDVDPADLLEQLEELPVEDDEDRR